MGLKNSRAVFAYNSRKGPLHRVPALVKLVALLPLSIVCLALPLPALAAGIALAAIAASVCGFRLSEQLCDLKPVLFYSILMYVLSIVSRLVEWQFPSPLVFSLEFLKELFITTFTPRPDFLFSCLRLAIIVQLSALLFRTTTTLQIRDSLGAIECGIRRRLSRRQNSAQRPIKPRIAETIALFAAFIPEIFQTWSQIDRAWRARGGKNNLAKIRTLVFVLITLSFEKAARKAMALSARE